MKKRNARRGNTQILCGNNFLSASPLEGEDVRRTKEGAWNKLGCIPPHPAFGHPLPQGARMTPHGFTARSVIAQCFHAGYSCYRSGVNLTQAASKLWNTCHTAGNLSGYHPTYKEESLNKDFFRAPLRFGFTLIELLVVVLIIGILAAIALPQYQKAVEKARVAEAITILKEMDKAQQLCVLEHGGKNCYAGYFFENSDYVPPTPLLTDYSENGCIDTAPCFHIKDWEFTSDDALRAYRIKNGEIQYDGALYISSSAGGYPNIVTCDGDYCSSIGM